MPRDESVLPNGDPPEPGAKGESGGPPAPLCGQDHVRRATTALQRGRLDAAVADLRQALRLEPDAAEAHDKLALALARQGKYAEAEASLWALLRQRPGAAEVQHRLAIALAKQRKGDEAAAAFAETLRLAPDLPEAHNNFGVLLQEVGKLEEAISHFRQALAVSPKSADAHNNLGVALAGLAAGDFAAGWVEYEWRWQGKDLPPRPFAQPAWDGTPLDGRTILLHAEQGLGDTLQLVRYAALVKERGGRVVLEGPKALLALLKSCAGIEQLVGRGEPLPAFDCHAPLLSLPRLFGTTLETVPASIPYLAADLGLVQRWRARLEDNHRLRVGIAWQGSSKYRGDRHRSIPLWHFAPLAEVPGVRLFSLQKGPGCKQLPAVAEHFWVTDLGAQLDEGTGAFVETAAVMKGLDLVVTSDTALAHLAGALGVPVWVALPLACDWRWLRGRDDSPWYPTLRLFRQRTWGDWDEVFARIAGELHGLLGSRPAAGLKSVAAREAERLHRRGLELLRAGQADEGVSTLRQALRLKPDLAEAQQDLGVALARQDKLEEAAACFAQALRLRPRAETHNNLGLALLNLGRLEEAAASFERALVLQAGAADVQNTLGVTRLRQGQPAEAVRHYQEALRLKPDYAKAHSNLGNALRLEGRPEEAAVHLREALRLAPELAAAQRNLALLESSQARQGEAIAPAPAADSGPAPALAGRPRATVCLLTYGDYLPYFRRCLESVLAHTPLTEVEVRLGFNDAAGSLAWAVQRLCPAGMALEWQPAAEGVQRLRFRGAAGQMVHLWASPVNLYKEPMARLLFYDRPLETEYVVWFDDDSFVSTGWWQALVPLLEQGVDYIGQEWWVDYLPGQAEMIQTQPWYRGVPFEERKGKPGVHFMTGGFLAVRTERLHEANFPDVAFGWKGHTLQQYGGDTLLGEIARQLGWSRAVHARGVQVNVDLEGKHPAPRRGGTGRQFGSDVDLVIQ